MTESLTISLIFPVVRLNVILCTIILISTTESSLWIEFTIKSYKIFTSRKRIWIILQTEARILYQVIISPFISLFMRHALLVESIIVELRIVSLHELTWILEHIIILNTTAGDTPLCLNIDICFSFSFLCCDKDNTSSTTRTIKCS